MTAETALDFLAREGRLPRLGDERPPWTFRAWLLPYVQEADRVAGADRWGHWLRTREAGRLLDEPIPRAAFEGRRGRQDVARWLKVLERRTPWGALELLVNFLAWGLGVGPDPGKYIEPAENEGLYRAVDVGPWLKEPSDYLGEFVAEHRAGGWNPLGFYPTPHALCEVTVEMTVANDERDRRSLTVLDPCVGSGRMLLHASNHSYRLSGQDIDPLMVSITKVNGAIFAPWLAFPAPESFWSETAEPAPARGVVVAPPVGQLRLFEEA